MHRVLLLFFLSGLFPLKAQELDLDRLFEDRSLGPVTELLGKGDYDLAARISEAAIQRGMKAPEWRLLRLRALRLMGQELEVRDEVQLAVKTFPDHLGLLMLQHDNARSLGRRDIAEAALKAINEAAKGKAVKDRTADEWVTLGQAALALGADAQKVIQQYFQVAQKKDPKLEAAYLAEGRLALAKDDAARAADVFRAGLKAHGETADLRAGLGLAYANSDRSNQQESMVRALELNPVHAEALLSQAEGFIGAEKFLEAEAAIQKVIEICETRAEAWALRAAVAHLSAADAGKVKSARANGLKLWDQDPVVDHTLGRVLSRAYRFAEGAAYQRQALAMDADFLPARVQLCHDLLRLGDEAEAWKLAASIREKDGYNVQAHNIGLLEREMNGYTTQSFDDFILKMPKRDWPIYGERALALLREAKAVLTAKYGLTLKRPVMVEFFGAQQDFAIRTFGSLGGQGLLGVCFGTVITMNTPGGLAHRGSNWEATLWHEYCHVVTLTLTKNQMPRWLSEGISVYEERQRNPVWGMDMKADFRRMILEENETTPVGQLSSAFLNAKDHEHTMFAYYQSSQVVSYLMETFGLARVQGILRDLAEGRRINAALEANTVALGTLEKDFDRYLKDKAEAYGQKADWDEPKPEDLNPSEPGALNAYHQKHPRNLWVIHQLVDALIEQENWAAVLPLADNLIKLVPEDLSEGGGHQLKALALRKLKRAEEEADVLRYIAERDSSAMSIYLRLIELDLAAKDWAKVQVNAKRAMELNPFLHSPQKALAESAEAQGQLDESIAAYRRVLILDPVGAAMTHFRLAQLLHSSDAPTAKKHLLDSLALAPRFREAQRLLLKWP
ncbi:MAG: peptidase MA family metallohydrolase [Verrucomicrobia bacterium]|nr:peptidase MA family metallohydrolase [Verrucomicrobiota bacterium]